MKIIELLLVVTLSFVSSPSFARPEYPARVREDLRLSPAPDNCTLCHAGTTGVKGTATKPFARSLQQYGVTGALDAQALDSALREIERCKVDSDGDGIDDVAEITAGTDPNDGQGTPLSTCNDLYSGPLPETGCAFVPYTAPGAGMLGAAFGCIWYLGRRVARRGRRARR